jgi:hypothetical protein
MVVLSRGKMAVLSRGSSVSSGAGILSFVTLVLLEKDCFRGYETCACETESPALHGFVRRLKKGWDGKIIVHHLII